jgi:protein NrfD
METIASPQTISPGRHSTAWAWAAALIASAAGVVGLVWRFTGGHAAADYGSYVPWGLWIAAYIALVGASAGAFAFAALIFTQRRVEHYRMAVLATLVALGAFAAGMANVWLDLGHPFRAWKMMTQTSFTSVMGWMAWFYVAYGIILVVGLVLTRKGRVPAFMERFGWVAFLFAVMFAGAEGALFGVVGARPLWESGLTPVMFLVEAGLLGLGLVAAAGVVFNMLERDLARKMGVALLVLLGLVVVFQWAEYTTALTAGVPAKAHAVEAVLTGPFWWVFWFVHLGLGIVVPGVILFTRLGNPLATGLAGALIAATGIAAKLNLVLSALTQESLEGITDAFTGPGLEAEYFPSLMEWLVWLGTLGMAGLIVLIGRRLLSGFFDTGDTGDTGDTQVTLSEEETR